MHSSPHNSPYSSPYSSQNNSQNDLLPVLRLLRTPTHTRLLAQMLVCLIFVSIAALIFVPWQQNIAGHGRVIAYAPLERQQNIEAPVDGRVLRWLVAEGTLVKEGDLLAEMTDNDPEFFTRLRQEREIIYQRSLAIEGRIDALDDRIASLLSARTGAIDGADRRVAMARDRLRSSREFLSAAEATAETAVLNQDRQKSLLEKGLTSTRSKELADLEVTRTQTEVERAKASISAAENELNALGADAKRLANDTKAALSDAKATRASAESELASIRAEITRLDVRLARQSNQNVVAPRAGTVLRLLVNQGGEQVKAGDPLAILVPDTQQKAVEVWVSGNDAPLIAKDDMVRLQFEGWPAIQFTGWPSVAVGTFGGRVAFVDSTDDGNGKFRVVVLPDETNTPDGINNPPWPSSTYLRQGVRTNGWVLLRQVSLGYELWRQFNGFPPSKLPPTGTASGVGGMGKDAKGGK